MSDRSPWDTARWELWEEAGIWLDWRDQGEFTWLERERVVSEPSLNCNAWLVTAQKETDEEVIPQKCVWWTLKECYENKVREDHLKVLRMVDRSISDVRFS